MAQKGWTRFWRNPMEALFIITLCLIILGTINILNASFVIGEQNYQDSFYFLKRHLGSVFIGLIALIVTANSDYRRLRRKIGPLFVVTAILLLYVELFGHSANGATRWIKLGFFSFQPSELAKYVAVLFAASILGPRLDRQRKIELFSAPLLLMGLLVGLVVVQPDMGTGMVIAGLYVSLYVLAGIPNKELKILTGLGILGVIGLIYISSYRSERILAWIDPWRYQSTIGYQTVQSLIAIGSGGFWGTGLGMGSSKFSYLPEAHTDFAFAVICQELGFIGAFILIALFTALAFFGIQVAMKAPDNFGMILGFGMVLLIVGEALFNMSMVAGLAPVTGVPLPFISYGGTALLINLIAIGTLISIARIGLKASKKTEAPAESSEAARRLRLIRRS